MHNHRREFRRSNGREKGSSTQVQMFVSADFDVGLELEMRRQPNFPEVPAQPPLQNDHGAALLFAIQTNSLARRHQTHQLQQPNHQRGTRPENRVVPGNHFEHFQHFVRQRQRRHQTQTNGRQQKVHHLRLQRLQLPAQAQVREKTREQLEDVQKVHRRHGALPELQLLPRVSGEAARGLERGEFGRGDFFAEDLQFGVDFDRLRRREPSENDFGLLHRQNRRHRLHDSAAERVQLPHDAVPELLDFPQPLLLQRQPQKQQRPQLELREPHENHSRLDELDQRDSHPRAAQVPRVRAEHRETVGQLRRDDVPAPAIVLLVGHFLPVRFYAVEIFDESARKQKVFPGRKNPRIHQRQGTQFTLPQKRHRKKGLEKLRFGLGRRLLQKVRNLANRKHFHHVFENAQKQLFYARLGGVLEQHSEEEQVQGRNSAEIDGEGRKKLRFALEGKTGPRDSRKRQSRRIFGNQTFFGRVFQQRFERGLHSHGNGKNRRESQNEPAVQILGQKRNFEGNGPGLHFEPDVVEQSRTILAGVQEKSGEPVEHVFLPDDFARKVARNEVLPELLQRGKQLQVHRRNARANAHQRKVRSVPPQPAQHVFEVHLHLRRAQQRRLQKQLEFALRRRLQRHQQLL